MVQSAGKGKHERERIIVIVRSPWQENDPADAHTSAHKSVLESANPACTWSVHLGAPGQQHGQQPVSGTADPRVVKQDKASRGSVATTKTHSGPQRVGMHHGRMPIGAAKGKQTNTMASCQTPQLGGQTRRRYRQAPPQTGGHSWLSILHPGEPNPTNPFMGACGT